MMYSEFLNGTGAPENSQSYEQFLKIEQIYKIGRASCRERVFRAV